MIAPSMKTAISTWMMAQMPTMSATPPCVAHQGAGRHGFHIAQDWGKFGGRSRLRSAGTVAGTSHSDAAGETVNGYIAPSRPAATITGLADQEQADRSENATPSEGCEIPPAAGCGQSGFRGGMAPGYHPPSAVGTGAAGLNHGVHHIRRAANTASTAPSWRLRTQPESPCPPLSVRTRRDSRHPARARESSGEKPLARTRGTYFLQPSLAFRASKVSRRPFSTSRNSRSSFRR